jgi:hypothetical protein
MPRMMKHDKGQENDKMAKREGRKRSNNLS